MEPKQRTVYAQPSWVLESDNVEVCLTQRGGMMAPVTFYRNTGKPIQPYYVSPWQEESRARDDSVLGTLRGDFFCMPFGANNAYRGEQHDVHGEPATRDWSPVGVEATNGLLRFEAQMRTEERPGTVTKRLFLKDGENVVYSQHELAGYSGKMSLGHHATLDPARDDGGMLIATSPIELGVTRPNPPYHNVGGEYAALADEATFAKLTKVPTVWKRDPYADCSRFPDREGYCDILAVYAKQPTGGRGGSSREPASSDMPVPAWTAAAFPKRKYLWFALKDPRTLPATVFWMENFGRHAAPWNGRNCCIGLEDVCGYLAEGLVPSSKKNVASEAGLTTSVTLSPKRAHRINYIQGVVAIPAGFDRVKTVSFSEGRARFRSESGKTVETSVQWSFLFGGSLA